MDETGQKGKSPEKIQVPGERDGSGGETNGHTNDVNDMKAVMIVYNQANTERVEYMLDHLDIRGYTQWEGVKGQGSRNGSPHLGSHTWPELNSAVLTVVENEKVEELLDAVKKLDGINEEVGVRAFVWEIVRSV
jgi:nitrogen regulatory protein PII